ncbi:alanine racemase [Sodalis sp. RH21]|uniref:alanine racemase n=1 Tax=unclassified Sodalis (in: enterobacteria) TaxID=2636512 RepID=UPI0039B50361
MQNSTLPDSTDIIETPYLMLDVQRLDNNIKRMRAKLAPFNVTLRPHVKTNKSLEVTARLFAGEPGPITVSTLREADYFFAAGYTDILYGVAISPNKFDHAARLIGAGCRLLCILDNLDTALALAAYAERTAINFAVLLEIDCDGHRSGLPPRSPVLLDIARLMQHGKVHFRGVMTHAGNSYFCRSADALEQCAREERDAVVNSADMLRQAGFAVDIISVGSTPTALFVRDLTGVTEVRAGVFAFFDLVMAGLGVCRLEDIALSVVTTVIGHQADKGWTIVDAGWMALSRDRGTAAQAIDQGYGVVCDMHGRPIADLILQGANQEHGIIASRSGTGAPPSLPIGALLRILPNHACATAAQYNGYYLAGTERAYWPRINGW